MDIEKKMSEVALQIREGREHRPQLVLEHDQLQYKLAILEDLLEDVFGDTQEDIDLASEEIHLLVNIEKEKRGWLPDSLEVAVFEATNAAQEWWKPIPEYLTEEIASKVWKSPSSRKRFSKKLRWGTGVTT